MRKQCWKKILSAVVATSMVVSLAPVYAGASSAQGKVTSKAVSGKRKAAQSIDDVLDRAIKKTQWGCSVWYFPKAVDGVVDAGTLYVKGEEGKWISDSAGRYWEEQQPDMPIKSLIVKNADLGQYAFNNQKELRKVKLEGVTTIKSQCFASCPMLREVDLGDAVTELGDGVFMDDTALTRVRIPAGVTKLRSSLFSRCSNLRDLAVCTTEAQPEMGSTAPGTFAQSQSLIYVESGRGGIYHPFSGCSDLTVYVAERGNGIETAMDFTYKEFCGGAYQGNSDLAGVTYSISTLDQYEAKKQAAGEVAVSCPDVLSGTAPSPVITKNETGIADANPAWLYYDAKGRSVSVEDVTGGVGQYYVQAVLRDAAHFVYMSDMIPFQMLASYAYTIKDGVLKIAPRSGVEQCAIPDFEDPSDRYAANKAPWLDGDYTRVEVADGITSIGSYAFAGCEQVTKISLPEGLESLGSYAFAYDSSLRMVEGLEKTKITKLSGGTFAECTSLTGVHLPPTLSEIGIFAFETCRVLSNLIIQGGADTDVNIKMWAFDGCPSLKNVYISGKKITLGGSAFSSCDALEKVTIAGVTGQEGSELSVSSSSFGSAAPTIYVPNADLQAVVRASLSSKDAYAEDADKDPAEQKIRVSSGESAVKKLSDLTIELKEDAKDPGQAFAPSVVEKTGDGAVTYWYYKLEAGKYVLADPENPATVPSQMGTYYIQGHMAETDQYYGCASNRVTCVVNGTIEEEGFDFDSKTGVLTIKKNMSDLDALQAVFSDYQTRIKEVGWAESEEGYTSVPDFSDCTALVKVKNIPKGTTFTNCRSLTAVTFAEDYSGAGPGVFTGCSSLTDIEILPDMTEIAKDAFKNCTSLQKVTFLCKHDGTNSLTEIKQSAFENCTSLKAIVLPKPVYESGIDGGIDIDASAFAGCSALETVEVKAVICKVSKAAFKDCTQLCSVKFYLPSPGEEIRSPSYIYAGAFENAGTEAERLVVTMTGTMDVWDSAFKYSGVTDIIWDSLNGYKHTITVINENALLLCDRLKTVTLREMNYTENQVPGIVNGNFTALCPEDLVIYATGDTYDLLADNGYTNIQDFKTVTAAKKEAFTASEELYKGLDASLYGADALKAFLEESFPMAKELVEEAVGEESTMNVFEQADIIDQAEAFLADAFFGEGGPAEAPAAAVAGLTKDLQETAYTVESWKALTDAQTAVAEFLEKRPAGAASAQVREFDGLVKAAMAVELVKKTEAGTPAPGGDTPAPGGNTPAPGGDTPAPGGNTPAPGGNTPAPGGNTPAPGGDTPAPGGNTPAPGGNTPAPGGNTPAPGGNTPAPDQPQALAAVKISKVTAKKKSAAVKWKKTAGANGYQISYGLKKSFKGAKTVAVKGSKTSYTIKKLKKGKVYYIRIRAYRTVSGKKQYGKWSGTKKVKIK